MEATSTDTIEPLWDARKVAKITGRKESTLEKDRALGSGPPFIKIGRSIRYRPSDVRAWLNSFRVMRSTREMRAQT
jgi:predicted DNA-binding transcriptional regulator AlpA